MHITFLTQNMPQNPWKQKRSAMIHYDQTADAYDGQYGEEQEAKIKSALQNLIIPHNAIVLDAGCGTGLLIPRIAQRAQQIVGIDASRNLLRQARIRAQAYRNVSLIRADTDYAPLRRSIFSHAFAFTLLQNMPNPTATLREIQRVTIEKATIVATGLKKEFTEKAFIKLLTNAGLSVTALWIDERLKDHVAVCQKRL